ncbi:MAG: MFS transporter, partial [Firmicutes bacterium]|nr:MFS transporter [Bacillota bacterium]
FSGIIYSRQGIVRVMKISAVGLSLAYGMQIIASRLWHFYVIAFLIGIFNTLGAAMPLSLLIAQWFTGNRNTITGVVMMGSGFGTTLFVNLASELILRFGWRPALLTLTLIMAAVSITVNFLLLKEHPEAAGVSAKKGAVSGGANFFTARNLTVGVMLALIAVGVSCSLSPLTPYLQDIGYSQSFAAAAYSGMMISSAVGKIFHGIALDKLGVRRSCTVMLITAILGTLASVFFASPVYVVPVALGAFLVSSLQVVASPAIAAFLGGEENQKFFLGKQNIFISIGYLIAPLIYGTIYDSTGSYIPSFWLAIGAFAVSMVIVQTVFRQKKGEEAL